MIIKKHTFQFRGVDYRVDYIIFDDKNIHLNKRGSCKPRLPSWKPIDDICVYDLIYIHFYPNSSTNERSLASIWDVRYIIMSRDSILEYLNKFYYIKVEEESDEFREIANLYNTLI